MANEKMSVDSVGLGLKLCGHHERERAGHQGRRHSRGSKNAWCVGCHGIQGYHIGFPEVHKVPKISGRGAGYIRAALNAYKTGERKHPSMRTLAASLNDQDIADLAATLSPAAVVSTCQPRPPRAPSRRLN